MLHFEVELHRSFVLPPSFSSLKLQLTKTPLILSCLDSAVAFTYVEGFVFPQGQIRMIQKCGRLERLFQQFLVEPLVFEQPFVFYLKNRPYL
jgi:hypothetical protein